MVVWSKTLPLTASCLLPLTGFESWPGHVRKLPVTNWGQAVVFIRYSGFLHHLQPASHNLISCNMAEKVTKNIIPNPERRLQQACHVSMEVCYDIS